MNIIENQVIDGPHKIFIGGIPYQLNDEQVKELLTAFGKLKAFHLVKETGTQNSKGYAFCEYVDHAVTEVCVAGLNGMNLGGQPLTVRIAKPRTAEEEAAQAAAAGMASSQSAVQYGTQPSADVNALLADAFSNAQGGDVALTAIGGHSAETNAALDAAFAGSNSSVLSLSNMVTNDDLADDEEYKYLFEDVESECRKYGNLQTVHIPRIGATGQGKVFLAYLTGGDAATAFTALNGREFGPNRVAVEYYSEGDFRSGIFR
jgi:splicing factor U2AF 65 kDa subunit